MKSRFHSNGKLLLTGEYVVLDGALALALPTRFGQSLEISPSTGEYNTWTALDNAGNKWLEANLSLENGEFLSAEENPDNKLLVKKLQEILTEANKLNPNLFGNGEVYNIITKLDFPLNWGLGSSSTLINNIALWFEIDPYLLLQNTFGGSGFDIAAAQTNQPVSYQLLPEGRSVLNANFDPPFKDELFFVHLNRKQNSRSSIAHYRQQPAQFMESSIEKISALTASFISCENLAEFKLLIKIHETVISKIINTPKVKDQLFPDFQGSIKSLGGWGGDFILATGGDNEKEYFKRKGYSTILGYREIIK